MLSHDSIVCWQGRPVPIRESHEDVLAMLPDWRPTSILTKIVPQLREGGLTEADITTILVDNPRRFFAGN
jgi:phosphotriesterase-related protein